MADCDIDPVTPVLTDHDFAGHLHALGGREFGWRPDADVKGTHICTVRRGGPRGYHRQARTSQRLAGISLL